MSEEDYAWYRGLVKHVDPFYDAKFEHGEVRPGWDFAAWTLDRVAGIPIFGTANCRRH